MAASVPAIMTTFQPAQNSRGKKEEEKEEGRGEENSNSDGYVGRLLRTDT